MGEILRKAPFARIFLFIASGILFSHYLPIPLNYFWVLSFAALLWLLLIWSYYKLKTFFYDLLWGGLAAIFMFNFGILLGLRSAPLTDLPTFEKPVVFFAVVKNSEIKETGVARYIAQLIRIENDPIISKEIGVRLVVQGDSVLKPGTLIACRGNLRLIENSGEIGETDYKSWANRKGIYYTAKIPLSNVRVIDIQPVNILYRIRDRIKDFIYAVYEKYRIPKHELAVLSALTIGDKTLLDTGLRTSFSTAGLMHVLAVSGLHVGIIYLIVLFLLRPLDRFPSGKIFRVVVSIIILFFYAFLTGLSASVLRASVMFSFLVFGEAMGKRYTSVNSLFASAVILLFYDPLIIFDIGFQLSYLAVFSIFLFYEPINSWFYFENRFADKIWSLCALALAAQLGTTPISLYYFNQFPTYFLVGNLLIVPLVGVVIQLAIILLALSFFDPFANIVAWILKFLLHIIVTYSNAITSMPFSKIENIFFDRFILVLLYIFLGAVYSFYVNPKPRYLIQSSMIVFFLVLYSFLLNFTVVNQRREIFATRETSPTLIFVDKNTFSTINIDTTINVAEIARRVSSHYGQPMTHLGHFSPKTSQSVWIFGQERVLFAPNDKRNHEISKDSLTLGCFRRGEVVRFK